MIAFIIFLIYITLATYKNNGIPESLSATYYLWEHKFIFPLVISIIGILLLPEWLDATDGSNFQFIPFLACGGLMFISSVPDYKNDKGQFKIHMSLAYLITGLSLLYLLKNWYLFPIIFVLSCLFDLKNFRKNYVYHIEYALILSIIISL